jgi:hypothetical protein
MTEEEWNALLCREMGWPATPWTIAGIKLWSRKESPQEANGQTRLFNRCFNPLATTYVGADAPRSAEDLGFGPGKWNNANPPQGVGIYATPEAGVKATASTLKLSYYHAIRTTFYMQLIPDPVTLRENFVTWIGSDAYAADLVRELQGLSASKEPIATVSDAKLLEAVVKLLGGKANLLKQANEDGDNLWVGYEKAMERLALAEQAAARAHERIDRFIEADIVPDHVHKIDLSFIGQTLGVK